LTRSSAGVSVIDNKIIVYGGENEARQPINSVIQVLEGKEWKNIVISKDSPEPAPRIAHT